MRLGIADPPYLGQGSRYYGHLHPHAAAWDEPGTHVDLLRRLEEDFDGWVYACSTPMLRLLLPHTDRAVRTGVWVKTRAGGRRPYSRVGWAHEHVLFRNARPGGDAYMGRQDILLCPSTVAKGLVGAKPQRWAWWALDLAGYLPGEDGVTDLFPGTGAVTAAVETYRPGCLVCEAPMDRKKRADRLYCSDACRQKAHRARSG